MKQDIAIAISAVACVGTWIGAFAAIGCDMGQIAQCALVSVAVLSAGAFGWAVRSRIVVPDRETEHNKMCRKLLSDLAELPFGERYAHVMKLAEHDRIEGRFDIVNAVESLKEQGCIRNVEVRWHLDGNAGIYADGDISVTGKRYAND